MFDNICNNCLNSCSQASMCSKRKCNDISILNAISTSEVTVNPGNAIPFNANRVCISEDISHIANSENFGICTPGVYEATLTTNARLSMGESINSVSVAIAINGVIIPGTIATESCGPNEKVNLSTQLVFVITNGTSANLTIVNPNNNTPITVYDNTNIIIKRVG